MKKQKLGVATQKRLEIAEIRDGMVVLRDGTVRGVIAVSSINFALKSEEEQEAIISAYVGFLNTLEYPLQIVIQSRKLNIDDYLARLKQSELQQSNELLKTQIADYRSFVASLITLGQIMAKRFFVVVPYDPLTNKRKGFFSRFKELFSPAVVIRLKEERFAERKKSLDARLGQAMSGLASIGLDARPLDTQSLIELYYEAYNPDIRETQKLTDVASVRAE